MDEQYIVSARKYRPGIFSDVVGQDHISMTLKKALMNKHIAQAYLFTGPRGIGKTTCARIFAKALNCENLEESGEPCNKCHSCRIFNDQRSLNIYELDAASNNSVDDIRALVDQIRFPPQTGKYKTYIIDEVHMLTSNAFNAFLKTLEEPPSYAIFILATTEKHKIIPTILSRCQIYDFNRIKIQDIIEQLKFISEKENISYDAEALHIIAQKADGALRDALSIFDRLVSYTGNEIRYDFVIKNLNIIDYEYFFKSTDLIIDGKLPELLLLFHEILNAGFEGQNYLLGLAEHFRNLLVARNKETLVLLETPESSKTQYQSQSESINKGLIISALNIINTFTLSYKESKNQRLHVEIALMKLCYLPQAIKLADISPSEQKKKSVVDIAKSTETTIKKKNILNLDSIKNEIKKRDIDNGKESEQEKPAEKTHEPVNPEKFAEIWEDYLNQILQLKTPMLYNVLKEKIPREKETNIYTITVGNKALEELFTEERQNIIDYFAEHHQVKGIRIECRVMEPSKDEKAKYLVNSLDVYNRMKELNPDIVSFREVLKLKALD
jgi:DNA polymerase III subunit gamma/tau